MPAPARGSALNTNGSPRCLEGGTEVMERLLSVPDAAALLGCSPAAIRKWLSQGQLKGVKVGRLTRLRVSELEAFVQPRNGGR
jgi:excisionase family DNA binding protein